MSNIFYIVYEQVGAHGIDKYLVPLLDMAPEPYEAKKFSSIICKQLANGYYEYIQSKKVFKINRRTGMVEQ